MGVNANIIHAMNILNTKLTAFLSIFVCCFCSYALMCNTELIFNEEGNVRAVLEITIPDKAAGILRGFFLSASEGMHEGPLDEDAVRRAFLDTEGLWTLEEYNVYTMRGARRVRIQAMAEDALKALNGEGLLKGVTLTSNEAGGEYRLKVAMPVPKPWNGERAANARRLMEMLDGMEAVLTVQAPNTILETTGTRDTLERCRWQLGPESFLQNTMPEISASWHFERAEIPSPEPTLELE